VGIDLSKKIEWIWLASNFVAKMTITKTQLKKIAAAAWTECFNNLGYNNTIEIEIDGEEDDILPLLQELADEMNAREDNSDYTCGVGYDHDRYEFYVFEKDPQEACYQFNDEEDDTEIIATSAELVDSEGISSSLITILMNLKSK
jgi:hypothetical protein